MLFIMSKIELFIFRHGETDWNRERRLQGHTDIPLNENGRMQAQALAEKLRHLNPQVILSSDLSRAMETAEIANTHLNIPIHHTEHLRECRMGTPEGMLKEDVLSHFGDSSWDRWISTKEEDQDFMFENGESKREHLMRMKKYIEEFLHTNTHFERIAVSTHGGSLYRLLQHCVGSPETQPAMPNCALFKMTYDTQIRRWYFEVL
jgi:probable phosphoglycerate mutase